MKKKLLITLTIALSIILVGCYSKSEEDPTKIITATKNYQEIFNDEEKYWSITFEELSEPLIKEFSIDDMNMLIVKGKIESGYSNLNVRQESISNDDKDIIAVPLYNEEVRYMLDRWDTSKKLILELSPKGAKNGDITITLTKE